jgi:hypothetical protein
MLAGPDQTGGGISASFRGHDGGRHLLAVRARVDALGLLWPSCGISSIVWLLLGWVACSVVTKQALAQRIIDGHALQVRPVSFVTLSQSSFTADNQHSRHTHITDGG